MEVNSISTAGVSGYGWLVDEWNGTAWHDMAAHDEMAQVIDVHTRRLVYEVMLRTRADENDK